MPISGRLANSESAEMTLSVAKRHTHWLIGRKIEIYAAKNTETEQMVNNSQ